MFLENRLIAMVDVLGFAAKIQDRTGLETTLARYTELIKQAREHEFTTASVDPSQPPPKNFAFDQFVFDTIVLVSQPTNTLSISNFILGILWLMDTFFKSGFPLRGAIGVGDLCTDGAIFLSDAFKRLKTAEDQQQWTGCVLLPDAEFVVEELFGPPIEHVPDQSSTLHRLMVPNKQNLPLEHWALNWSWFLTPQELKQGIEGMVGDPEKQKNTARYLEGLKALRDPTTILQSAFLPATCAKSMATRSGCRVKFLDQSGQGVAPGCEFRLEVISEINGDS